nr:hypothetical transcript [Hymenolepis microstoma]
MASTSSKHPHNSLRRPVSPLLESPSRSLPLNPKSNSHDILKGLFSFEIDMPKCSRLNFVFWIKLMTRLRSSTLHHLLILHYLVAALLPSHRPHPQPLPLPPSPLAPPSLLLPTLASAHQGHAKDQQNTLFSVKAQTTNTPTVNRACQYKQCHQKIIAAEGN